MATADSSDTDDESLADAFWSVARQLRLSAKDTLAPYDVSPSQLRALRVLLRHGELRLSDLSEHLHIAARSATEVVDGLEARGLVRRGPDPSDRRATLVAVTDDGHRTMDEIRAARRQEADRLFSRLSARDSAELARILRTLVD